MRKLSQMNTEELADVMVKIVPELGEILADKEVTELMRGTEKGNIYEVGIRRITKLIPLALEKYRENVYSILSVMSGKEESEIAEQPGFKTVKEVMEILKDEDLKDFFA